MDKNVRKFRNLDSNPCIEESDGSQKCLVANNYDHSKCTVYFLRYKKCRKYWVHVSLRQAELGTPAQPRDHRRGTITPTPHATRGTITPHSTRGTITPTPRGGPSPPTPHATRGTITPTPRGGPPPPAGTPGRQVPGPSHRDPLTGTGARGHVLMTRTRTHLLTLHNLLMDPYVDLCCSLGLPAWIASVLHAAKRLRSDRARRRKAYRLLQRKLMVHGVGVKEGDRVQPTYVYPEEVKTLVRSVFPEDVRDYPDPRHDQAGTGTSRDPPGLGSRPPRLIAR
ncbi:Coiled-coil-helix-coiled-coil-helix domain-containing protein 7 [Liparis tanakae]|uniref:Coiled-coil-helix-coiled-coil-helix domain-containing protein 7 n=1 Tax=Liparis tanakae TaxID=230148 RepID=A0A4Z2H5L2_9TELE|nr:Coiled-coil-helix-coiled-coil-helix domain-containing protein 7 [Liparis tanakae]